MFGSVFRKCTESSRNQNSAVDRRHVGPPYRSRLSNVLYLSLYYKARHKRSHLMDEDSRVIAIDHCVVAFVEMVPYVEEIEDKSWSPMVVTINILNQLYYNTTRSHLLPM